MTSKKQSKANRKNALKSTGPRKTSVTRFNAVKHGILSSEVLLTTGPGKEDAKIFKQLVVDLCTQFEPEGPMEHALVEKAAIDLWRLRRLYQAERGQLIRQYYDVSGNAKDRVDSQISISRLTEGEVSLLMPKHRTEELLELRKEQHEGIRSQSLSPEEIAEHFTLEELENKEALYAAALVACEESIRFLELCIDVYDVTVEVTEEVMKEQNRIPTNFETLLRYDTTITRNLFRTLRELDRLQRRRRGEPIPSIDLNIDKPD